MNNYYTQRVRFDEACEKLISLMFDGWEWTDASAQVSQDFGVSIDALRIFYDEQSS